MSSQQGRFPKPVGAQGLLSAFNGGDVPQAIPDAPTLRSLQIGVSKGPSLVQRPPSFGKGGLGISRPARLSSRGVSLKGDSYEVKQEWTGDAPPKFWDVKAEDLEMVPEDYPLERTHRYIDNVEASEVATRISDSLRELSIEAEFNKKPPKAKCRTNDFVSFRIRLYAGSESCDPVVVEVQRRSGSAPIFMKSCRAILLAAEGKKAPAPKSPFKIPVGQMKCLKEAKVPVVADEAADVLDGAMDMLRSKQRDTNVLGLENLCSLTDPIKTNHNVALRVSKCVVIGDEKYDIREEIQVLIERDVYDAGDDDDAAMQHHVELTRQLALQIFANALEMCSKDGSLSVAVESQSWFKDHLIPTLVDEIKRAETNGCNATTACSCVHSLAIGSGPAKKELLEHGINDLIRHAHDHGRSRNALLANEASRCSKLFDAGQATDA